jgi:hypothetical protein
MSRVLGISVPGIMEFISDLTTKIAAAAWTIFLLSWSVGWLLRGIPLPSMRLKRTGQGIIEDAIWAAFWLAVGSSVFALIQYVASFFASSPTNATVLPP